MQPKWFVGPVESHIQPPMAHVVTVYNVHDDIVVYVARSPLVPNKPTALTTPDIARVVADALNLMEELANG